MTRQSFLSVLFYAVFLVVGAVGTLVFLVCAFLRLFWGPLPEAVWTWSVSAAIAGLSLAYTFYAFADTTPSELKTRAAYLRERKEAVYENLRDLNFEYKAGKVPDADYQSMHTSLEEEAAAIMSEISRLEQSVSAPGSEPA